VAATLTAQTAIEPCTKHRHYRPRRPEVNASGPRAVLWRGRRRRNRQLQHCHRQLRRRRSPPLDALPFFL